MPICTAPSSGPARRVARRAAQLWMTPISGLIFAVALASRRLSRRPSAGTGQSHCRQERGRPHQAGPGAARGGGGPGRRPPTGPARSPDGEPDQVARSSGSPVNATATAGAAPSRRGSSDPARSEERRDREEQRHRDADHHRRDRPAGDPRRVGTGPDGLVVVGRPAPRRRRKPAPTPPSPRTVPVRRESPRLPLPPGRAGRAGAARAGGGAAAGAGADAPFPARRGAGRDRGSGGRHRKLPAAWPPPPWPRRWGRGGAGGARRTR